MKVLLTDGIDSYEASLRQGDMLTAKKMINHFLKTVKAESDSADAPGLYYTTIMMMHIMSSDLINAFSPAALSTMLNAWEKIDKDE